MVTKKNVPRLNGSFSVEAAFVFSIVFFSISVAIRFAFTQRNACLSAFVLSESCEQLSCAEELYMPDFITPTLQTAILKRRLSPIGSFRESECSVKKRSLHVESSLENGSMKLRAKRKIHSPESTMRASTALTDWKKSKVLKGEKSHEPNTK